MCTLHLKVPPVAAALIAAALMYGLSAIPPQSSFPLPHKNTITVIVFLFGFSIAASGVVSFHRRETTVNPTRPSTTKSLVANGVYQFSRNPMYLGLSVVLVALGVYLANPLVMIVVVTAFVLYMNKYQIEPEEQALQRLFGEDFTAYKKNVRRWF
jgi:protein-S-isoprenylcysteine O-methyltransferase Ste14